MVTWTNLGEKMKAGEKEIRMKNELMREMKAKKMKF